MNSPVRFIGGLFVGVLIMGCLLWEEKHELKELKKELIEYADKLINK